MSNLKSNGRASITIGQSIRNYIIENKSRFENKMPPLGERWIVRWEFFSKAYGCDLIRITNDDGDWMTLPKSII